jgi:hypothetical protein
MSVINTDPTLLREKVRGAYSSAAEHPEVNHSFPVGRQFAESLGYPADLLASLPSVACDAFAGVSNVSLFADLPVGATVLDLGSGPVRTHSLPHGGWGRLERLLAWTSAPQCYLVLAKPSPNLVSSM